MYMLPSYWSFVKVLCEARPKMHSVYKFSDNLSALSQMDPLPKIVRLTFGHTLGQTDLWLEVPSP